MAQKGWPCVGSVVAQGSWNVWAAGKESSCNHVWGERRKGSIYICDRSRIMNSWKSGTVSMLVEQRTTKRHRYVRINKLGNVVPFGMQNSPLYQCALVVSLANRLHWGRTTYNLCVLCIYENWWKFRFLFLNVNISVHVLLISLPKNLFPPLFISAHGHCYGLNCAPSPPNSYVEVLTPNMTVFRNRVCRWWLRLLIKWVKDGPLIRKDWWPYKKGKSDLFLSTSTDGRPCKDTEIR